MAEKTYTAWVHVEVDGEETGEPAKLFETQNMEEIARFLGSLKYIPGYSIDIQNKAEEKE